MKIWIGLFCGMLGAAPMTAQVVVQPEPPLDSARASLRDALVVLRDSVATIDAAAARLQRDFREASGASLLSRAKVMRDACARSARSIPPIRNTVLNTPLATPAKQKARNELVGALDTLKGVLAGCEKEFAAMSQPDQGERVRGYGNDRAVRVLGSVRRFEHSMRRFLGVMGIRITPLGTTPPAVAG